MRTTRDKHSLSLGVVMYGSDNNNENNDNKRRTEQHMVYIPTPQHRHHSKLVAAAAVTEGARPPAVGTARANTGVTSSKV